MLTPPISQSISQSILPFILPVIGVLLAVAMPRWKYSNLMGFAGLLGLLAGGGLLLTLKPTILLMAAGTGAALLGMLLLARLVPRFFLFILLLLTMAATIGPRVGEALPLRIGAGIIMLSLLILGVIMVRFGLRLVWALIGAALILPGGKPWFWAGAAVGLFILNWLTTRKVEYKDPAWKKMMLVSVLIAGFVTVALLGVAFSAYARSPEITMVTIGEEIPPDGGLIWPLPSEAIFWGNSEFPAFENLDADYFLQDTEYSNHGKVVAVPGSAFLLFDRFELNSDIHRQRQIKSEAEIRHLQTAATAIVAALKETLPLIKAGGGEGAVAKSIHEKQALHGCEADSFPPIIAAGEHALDFHYMKNDGLMKAGDLVVIDIGCYAHHYASDFARTLPIGGKFSERQRKAYGAVYDAQQAAAALCKPGVWLKTPRKFRRKGTAAAAPPLQTGEFAPGKFSLELAARDTLRARGEDGDFGHGVGHPLGLFVHDVFDWKAPLQPGMVIMIEPGLYLKAEKTGIRLEDAYLVTKDGCELLTPGFPADADSIEKMMAELGPGS